MHNSSSSPDPIPGLGREGDAAAIFVALAKLRGWQGNPRRFSAEHVQEIAASMRRFGWGAPVLARSPEDPEIIAGHVRLLAGELLRVPVAPVRWMSHLSEAEARALNIADNQLASRSRWDDALLENALRELQAFSAEPGAQPIDLRVLGFGEKRLDALLAESPPVTVLELELGKLQDRFFLSVRGPVPTQPDVLDTIRRHLEGVEGLEVEIGILAR